MNYIYLMTVSLIIVISFYYFLPFYRLKIKSANVYGMEDGPLTLEEIYSAINQLETDYLMKKVSEQDFQDLKTRYQMLAAKLMNQEIKKVTTRAKKVDKSTELKIYHELENIRKGKVALSRN